ncbi:MAG TPA: hypothetical protein VJ813_11420 [Vicinamibacterales bacterium]|nr:hypothetical protein [Vicinamibacterales bacterium]
MAQAKPKAPSRPGIRRLGRIFVRLAKAALLAVLLAAAWSAGFIALRCYGDGGSPRAAATVERPGPDIPGYQREESFTFLSLPQWSIVYSSAEYGKTIAAQPPSAFPYAGSVRQYWRYYDAACRATKDTYPFTAGDHLMLGVMGSSFSIEYALKGFYENSFGGLAQWISGHDTPEDALARTTAAEYAAFMRNAPWYEFPFGTRLNALWRETPARGPHMVRKWERRLALTTEFGVKAATGWLIGLGRGGPSGQEGARIHARIEGARPGIYADGVVKKVRGAGTGAIVTLPRYEAFTARMIVLLQQGVRFVDIAGNDAILVTVLAPVSWSPSDLEASLVLDEPLLTAADLRRVALKVPVRVLHVVVPQIRVGGARVEHIYDY